MKRGPGKAFGLTLRHLFKKPATIAYPNGKLKIESNYRGKLVYDSASCIGCSICMRDCPAAAIEIQKTIVDGEKKFKCKLNYGHCIFCGQCAESCPKNCLYMSKNIELTAFSRQDLIEIME